MNPKQTIYLSLPITGRDETATRARARQLKAQAERMYPGAIVRTPFEIAPEEGKPYGYYMGRCIEALLECGAAVFAHDWHTSRGCSLEKETCRIYEIAHTVLCPDS